MNNAERRLFCGTLLAAVAGRALAQRPTDTHTPGQFDLVPGRAGIVIGVPHATADAGTREIGRILCQKTGASGVFVSGFWDDKTRQRVNVNRPTEQLISKDSEMLREWQSDRAQQANERYTALVKKASAGPLRAFYEIHSNHRPKFAGSIEVATQGVSRTEAARFKDQFVAARDRLGPAAPHLQIHVSPIDRVTYPNYSKTTTILRASPRGLLDRESPGAVSCCVRGTVRRRDRPTVNGPPFAGLVVLGMS